MKKNCKICLKHDRNHHAEDCLYCMQSDIRTIPKLLYNYFSKDDWDDGTTWPSIVQVNGKYYIKKYEAGRFGDIGQSHYEDLECNCVHLNLEELIK